MCLYHRRRMETEAKAKVVASVWGADFVLIPCRASYCASADLEEKYEFNRFFQTDRGKTASAVRNWTKSVPKQTRRPLPFASLSILLLWFIPYRCWPAQQMELCPADGQAEQCHPHPGYVAGSPKFNFPTTVPSNRIQYVSAMNILMISLL